MGDTFCRLRSKSAPSEPELSSDMASSSAMPCSEEGPGCPSEKLKSASTSGPGCERPEELRLDLDLMPGLRPTAGGDEPVGLPQPLPKPKSGESLLRSRNLAAASIEAQSPKLGRLSPRLCKLCRLDEGCIPQSRRDGRPRMSGLLPLAALLSGPDGLPPGIGMGKPLWVWDCCSWSALASEKGDIGLVGPAFRVPAAAEQGMYSFSLPLSRATANVGRACLESCLGELGSKGWITCRDEEARGMLPGSPVCSRPGEAAPPCASSAAQTCREGKK